MTELTPASATAWIDEQLVGAGLARTGEVGRARVRPWGTVLAAPTTCGQVWLKAPGRGTEFEVRLYGLLRRVVPEHVLAPIAVDVARGWILLPDGGPVLADTARGSDLVEAMVVLLPEYARLQRALIPHVGAMLAVGVADMRPAQMPDRFDEALDAVSRHIDRLGREPDRATYNRVAAHRSTFVSWCERLAAAPGEPSLDHNDLHAHNIFAGGRAGARFFDWGDSVIAHPFASMLVALRYVAKGLGAGADDPAVLRVRDAYLDVFNDVAPHSELVTTMGLACQVGKVARALVWHRALGTLEPDESDESGSQPLGWLNSLLEA